MAYVDGFLIPVPNHRKDEYRAHEEKWFPWFRDKGATSLVVCWGDDVPEGKVTSFPMAVQRKDDETVVFSWIWWPSKEKRDAGMAAAMQDPRLKEGMDPMPFDGQRMIYGGFEVIVDG